MHQAYRLINFTGSVSLMILLMLEHLELFSITQTLQYYPFWFASITPQVNDLLRADQAKVYFQSYGQILYVLQHLELHYSLHEF